VNAEEMRAALVIAFEELGVTGDQSALHRLIDQLVTIGQAPGLSEERQEIVRRSLRWAGRAASAKELERLAEATEAQVARIEALHRPATSALAKAGARNVNDEFFLHAQRQLAAKARAAKALIEDVGLKRTPDLRPRMVAGLVASAYEKFLGRHADLPNQSHGLEGLVQKVFKIMGLRATAKAALRAALQAREEFRKTVS
jgi:hypothetical protein